MNKKRSKVGLAAQNLAPTQTTNTFSTNSTADRPNSANTMDSSHNNNSSPRKNSLNSSVRMRKKSGAGAEKAAEKGEPAVSKRGQFFRTEIIHKATDSLFSSTSGYTNYRGFFNLAILLLVLSNTRVALNNIINKTKNQLELAARKRIKNRTLLFGYILDVSLLLFIPAYVSLAVELSPFSSVSLLGLVSCLSLKLISYAQVNYWCRSGTGNMVVLGNGVSGSRRPSVQYPENLSLGNLFYFLAAPTLCYELSFPKTPKFRKGFFLRRLVEVVLMSQLMVALAQQWIVPLLVNSQKPFIEMDYTRIAERAMKLAIPNHIIWLLNFYVLFHSTLNFMAELLRFADREFYRDWWNSETINYFWRAWNIPVHRWCTRHVFKPLRSAGYSSFTAAVVVFAISAFYHEYLVSVPLSMFRLWAFSAMMMQVPLSMVTEKMRGGRAGNFLVWISLIVGQPMAILMYVHDYYVINYLPQPQ